MQLNEDNSSRPLFESKKSMRENKSGLQTKTEGNKSTASLKGKQRNNRNTEVQHTQKKTMQHTLKRTIR